MLAMRYIQDIATYVKVGTINRQMHVDFSREVDHCRQISLSSDTAGQCLHNHFTADSV